MPESNKIDLSTISSQIVNILPETYIKKNFVLPIKITSTEFIIAIPDVDDLKICDDIELKVGLRPEPVEYPKQAILDAINFIFSVEKSTKQSLVDLRVKRRLEINSQESKEEEDFEFVSVDQPVVKLLNSILEGAIVKKASDIHIEPQDPEMRVRYRIDGTLITMMTIPPQVQNALVSRAKIISDMDITEKRRPQDGHYSHRFRGEVFDMRFSCIPTVKGEKMVLRILDKSRMSLGLSQLGFTDHASDKLKNLLENPYGMVFVTGPTGSGKTTTLYSMLNLLDRNQDNIVTAEDPVEYRLSGINQTQINSKIGLNFSGALRSFLRQDPDVIMVGEVRDYETAEIATQSALTGHLVLSTLHTNDAASAVTRLIDMGIEPFLIASTLMGVIAQRLARKICIHCQGKGCTSCHQTGLSGRTVLYEVLEITEPIRKLITQNVSSSDIKKAMIAEGMITFEQCGREKIEGNLCSPEEIRALIGDF